MFFSLSHLHNFVFIFHSANYLYSIEGSKPSKSSLVRYWLYRLNRISDKAAPSLNPLKNFTLLVSSWSSRTLTLRSKYYFLINILSLQSIPTFFRASMNLEQCVWSNVFCQSVKQGHTSLSASKVLSGISLRI